MKSLIIYDETGHIFQMFIGDGYMIPIGLTYIETIIPNGKYAKCVNVETKEVVFEDIPPTETEILDNKISILEQQNSQLETALVELASIVGGA